MQRYDDAEQADAARGDSDDALRDLKNARAALDMLAHRLREDGPDMTRGQIRERVLYAAEQINKVVPRSILRGGN